MIPRQGHVSDDRLIELCLNGPASSPSPGDTEHLHTCARCEGRRARLVDLLNDIDEAATRETDAVFPAERLARQRARILQRIDQDGRPARVIAFPAAAPDRWRPQRRPATRWIAAAAAAGLLIGILAGQFVRQVQGGAWQPVIQSVVTPETGPTLRAVAVGASDDQFLGEIETALDSSSASMLLPLHDLTPLAWEVAR